MNKFYTYVLYSEKYDRLYIGQTKDLKKRFNEHSRGKVDSTKPYRPYKLLYYEECDSREFAVKKEKEFKQAYKREFFKSLVKK